MDFSEPRNRNKNLPEASKQRTVNSLFINDLSEQGMYDSLDIPEPEYDFKLPKRTNGVSQSFDVSKTKNFYRLLTQPEFCDKQSIPGI